MTGPALSDRLPVVFVEYGIGFGGAVVSLSEMVRGLTAIEAVSPTVVTFQDPTVTAGLFPEALERHISRPLNYRTRERFARAVRRVAPVLVGPAMKVYALFDTAFERVLARRLERVIRESGARVVHLNNGRELSGLRAAKRAGASVVMHARGFGDRGITDMSAWEREVTGFYVAISTAVAEDLAACGAPKEKIRTVMNAVSTDRFDAAQGEREALRRSYGLSDDDVLVAVYGRITGWKGQLGFLEAIDAIAEECPNLAVAIVGDESDTAPTYIASVREAATGLSLAHDVIFTGYQKDVEAYYAMADIVVHSSRDPEPFGRVVIEGMAAGRAVVAMDEAGPQDIIEDGVDGLLVAPRDSAALGAAIRRLYADPDLRARMGRNARHTVGSKFTSTACAEQIRDLYTQLLSRDG